LFPIDSLPTSLDEQKSRGVRFNPPPETHLGPILSAVQNAAKEIPPDKHGAIISVFNETSGNAALVYKVNDEFVVQAWIGKTWKGSSNYGAAATYVF
jgi:hypothetical protein